MKKGVHDIGEQLIIILGTERSGSTWLANILDAHPDTDFYMEPFEDNLRLFPLLCQRNIYLSDLQEAENEWRRVFPNLHKVKYPLLYKPGKAMQLYFWDKKIVEILQSSRLRISSKQLMWAKRYQVLHQNKSQIPNDKIPSKRSGRIKVLKELRLNFKVPLLAKVAPNAKYLVAIRHPGAQIVSINKYFAKGRLGELKRHLQSFLQAINSNSRFIKYRPLLNIESLHEDSDLLLIVWWIINYDILFTDLRNTKLDFFIVPNEQISLSPENFIERVLLFLELPKEAAMESFIHWSTNSSGKGESPMDTIRDSRVYCQEQIASVPASLRAKLNNVFSLARSHIELQPELANYFSNDIEELMSGSR